MKTLLIIICILSIIYWITAKIGKYVYTSTKKEHDNWNEKRKDAQMKGCSFYDKEPNISVFVIPHNIAFLIVPIVIFFIMMFIAVIPSQKCGVIVTPTGVKQKTYETGWHFIMPYYKVYTMDKTSQVYTCAQRTSVQKGDEDNKSYKDDATQSTTIWTPTIDGIKMGFDISASWAIDPDYAWWIYDNVSEQDGGIKGRFYWLEENVIKAKLKSALALTTSKYTPIQIYSDKRQQIQDEVFEKMKQDISFYHLNLKQIDIREVYYNTEYESIINKKKLEEQEVLRLVEVTKQKEELKKQELLNKDIAITKAQGEAEALKIKGQAVVNNPKIVELEWIAKWDGKTFPNTILVSDGKNFMWNLPKQ